MTLAGGSILIILKDRLLTIAAGSDMIQCTGILDAQRAGHEFTFTTEGDNDAMLDLTPNQTP